MGSTVIASATFVLTKLVSKPLEQVGELLADKVNFWRYQNQISTLNKAVEYARAKGIEIKPVNLKTLFPLLDGASLEEEPSIQELWARLLISAGNTNASQGIKNITIDLLRALTPPDAQVLEAVFKSIFIRHKEDLRGKAELFRNHPHLRDKHEFNPYTNISPERLIGLTGLDLHSLQLSIDNISRFQIINRVPSGQADYSTMQNIDGHFSLTNTGWEVVCLLNNFTLADITKETRDEAEI